MTLHRRLSLLVLVIATASAGCGTAQPSSSPARRAPTMYEAFGSLQMAYPAAKTAAELQARSTAVIRGSFISVDQGRAVGGTRGTGDALDTILVRVQVGAVLSGRLPASSRTTLDLEMPRPDISPIAEFRSRMDRTSSVLFIVDTATLPRPGSVDTSGVSRDASKPLYALTTPQGLVKDGSRQLATPLEKHVPPGFFGSATTLHGLATTLKK